MAAVDENRLLERDARFSRIVLGHDGRPAAALELQELRPWRSADALLLPIGATLARLVVTEDFRYVKACEGPACTLLFADHTRVRARRWCSMAICGNRRSRRHIDSDSECANGTDRAAAK